MARLLPSPDATDFFVNPSFSLGNRLRRAIWRICYLLAFRPTPVPLFGWRSWLLRRFGATVGASNFIYPSCRIWAPWNLRTEDLATIGPYAEVYNPAPISLGHHAIVSQAAYLCGATHDFNDPAFPLVAKPIRVGPFAWVCAKAIVLPGVELGEGSVVGAGAVVSRSVEPFAVYAGNPARKVSERSAAAVSARATPAP